ncbi:ATP-binding protein [Candidatus Methylacidithermus pantelleriae]|uniref:histidine kinase n=1 Tax=Candidatus Methylacidithermus pantelleriae TaxID=2744239 RepID=A0A8J2FPU8_9BACT|nr:ATP-binding protein [Candidatus Methylacidithermus pantelleriae]CAF0705080.1 putative Histidine kinase [Candidatus Methylacidithermus pantelleriae]
MGLREKVQYAFGILFLSSTFSLLTQLVASYREKQVVEELTGSAGKLVQLEELASLVYRQVKEIPDYLTGRDPDAKGEYEQFEQKTQKSFAALRQRVASEEERKAFEQMIQAYERLQEIAGRIFRSFDGKDGGYALHLMEKDLEEEALPRFDRAVENLQGTFYGKKFRQATIESDRVTRGTFWATGTVAVLGLSITVLVSLWTKRELTDPLFQLVEAARELGGGNLEYRHPVKARGEVGDLAKAFWEMVDHLQQYQARLLEKERMATLGVVAASLAHGIRNPLACIRALAQVALLDGLDQPALQEQLRQIMVEVDRADEKIARLLRWADPAKRSPSFVLPEKLLQEVASRISKNAAEGVHIDVQVLGSVPCLWTDPERLCHALEELVLNAVQACRKRGGRITLRAQSLSATEGKETILLEVEDDGEGIPWSEQGKVRELFYTTRPEGTGLGLKLATKLIEWEGGELELQSTPGKGTRVRVLFPFSSRAQIEAVE